mmetsp:Transcript_31308/g.101139  ORF Transcript_31308/g.101139 Transcript_31308/m.101139 type:complete len:236 (-) Transcript_31308:582-1289(-)|eukprot:scaffold20758_cov129-Isochrysis_galbana.AAC.1
MRQWRRLHARRGAPCTICRNIRVKTPYVSHVPVLDARAGGSLSGALGPTWECPGDRSTGWLIKQELRSTVFSTCWLRSLSVPLGGGEGCQSMGRKGARRCVQISISHRDDDGLDGRACSGRVVCQEGRRYVERVEMGLTWFSKPWSIGGAVLRRCWCAGTRAKRVSRLCGILIFVVLYSMPTPTTTPTGRGWGICCRKARDGPRIVLWQDTDTTARPKRTRTPSDRNMSSAPGGT